MEIIIFIVLGSILLIKLLSERVAIKESNRELEKLVDTKEEANEFVEKYCDDVLERKIRFRLSSMSYDDLMDLIGPILISAGELESNVLNKRLFKQWINYNFHYVVMIEMAKHGKIPRVAAMSGIRMPIYIEDRPSADNLIKIIDDILFNHGVDEHIVVSNVDALKHCKENSFVVSPIGSLTYGFCKYYWWGMRAGVETWNGYKHLTIPDEWKFADTD